MNQVMMTVSVEKVANALHVYRLQYKEKVLEYIQRPGLEHFLVNPLFDFNLRMESVENLIEVSDKTLELSETTANILGMLILGKKPYAILRMEIEDAHKDNGNRPPGPVSPTFANKVAGDATLAGAPHKPAGV